MQSPGVSFPKLALFLLSYKLSGTLLLNGSVLTTTGPRVPGARSWRDRREAHFLFGFAVDPLGIVVLDCSGRRLGCFGQASLKDARSDGGDQPRLGSRGEPTPNRSPSLQMTFNQRSRTVIQFWLCVRCYMKLVK